MIKNLLFGLLLIGLSTSCTSPCDLCEDPNPLPNNLENAVWILNEGAYNWGNASLSCYFPDSQKVRNEVYASVNGEPLGDVAQSLTFVNGTAWVVVNNSGTVLALNARDASLKGRIVGFDSPRYASTFSDVSASHRKTGWVTDLYAGKLWKVNGPDYRILESRSISVNGWTEEIFYNPYEDEYYICNTDGDQLYILDGETETLDSLAVGRAPVSVLMDSQLKVWVLCDGGLGDELPRLQRIDPISRSIELDLAFPDISQSPSELKFEYTQDRIYWLNDGVWSMDAEAQSLPTTPLIPASGRNLYCLGVNPSTHLLYVGDAKDFVQKGQMYVYNLEGEIQNSFEVGVGPGYVSFPQ